MRSIIVGLGLCVCLSGIARAQAPSAPVPPVDLRDDRGEPVASPLEICYRTDLKSDCVELAAGDAFTPPAPLRRLNAEGPDHGPAAFGPEDLRPAEDGRLRLRIPRKALIQIDKPPVEPLDAAVYDVKAVSFEKPLASFQKVGPAGFKVPAGDLLVALSAGRKAPDLHRLTVQPGEKARLEYVPRDGWSLVVRSLDSRKRRAVASAVVSLTAVPGYDAPSRPAGEGKTGVDGLALFPGLARGRVDAGVRHADFLAQTAPGISTAPGGLVLRDVLLEEGGRVRASVRLKGKPREGALCKMVDFHAEPKDGKLPVLYEGRTDARGVCRTGRLPSGSYVFAVRLGEDRAPLARSVTLTDGVETAEDFSFAETRVRGMVTRQGDPAPGLTVSVLEHNEALDTYVGLAKATTGADGTYQLTVPKGGRYRFALWRAASTPVSYRDVLVDEGVETTVDFSLEKGTVRGKVVDEKEQPVEAAVVELRWSGSEAAYAKTGQGGEFELLLEGPGKGSVQAHKKGYRDSDFREIALEEGSEPEPVVLVMVRERAFRGTLLSVAGPPVAGGWIASVQNPLGDEAVAPSESRTDALGQFVLAPREGRRNRIFASGPGCPLSFFDPIDTDGELSLRCQGRAAVLEFTLTNGEGGPVPNVEVILRHGNAIIPSVVIERHLALQGLGAKTDKYGHLVIPNLAPGDYEVFVAGTVSEGMLESGSRSGFLARTHLDPVSTVHYHLIMSWAPPAGGGP